MHVSMIRSLLVLSAFTAMALSDTSNMQKRPTSVFGICNHIGTFPVPEVKQGLHWDTKVHWQRGRGTVVIKYKVGLTNLCKNMNKVMNDVQQNVRKMMFWRKMKKALVGKV